MPFLLPNQQRQSTEGQKWPKMSVLKNQTFSGPVMPENQGHFSTISGIEQLC